MAKTMTVRAPFRAGTKWKFKTKNFEVLFEITRLHHYQYDGEDADGETQRKINSGEYVAFASVVRVYCDGEEIAMDSLYGSVYDRDTAHEFWTAHRTSPPEQRNTLAMKAQNRCIGHYFPDMVRTAVREAREHINRYPKMRRP